MDVLDADDRRLGIEGRYAERDIVQVCIVYTHYYNSNLIWHTVSSQVDKLISLDHTRHKVARVIR